MGTFNDYQLILDNRTVGEETLRIHASKQKIRANISIFKFKDRDTKQIIFNIPSLDISSYGENEDKANEMLKSSIDDCFSTFSKMSKEELQKELSRLGWKKNIFRNKVFSQALIDIKGQLQNFNAVDDKVERLTLVA